jgi:hypothetical protein
VIEIEIARLIDQIVDSSLDLPFVYHVEYHRAITILCLRYLDYLMLVIYVIL